MKERSGAAFEREDWNEDWNENQNERQNDKLHKQEGRARRLELERREAVHGEPAMSAFQLFPGVVLALPYRSILIPVPHWQRCYFGRRVHFVIHALAYDLQSAR